MGRWIWRALRKYYIDCALAWEDIRDIAGLCREWNHVALVWSRDSSRLCAVE